MKTSLEYWDIVKETVTTKDGFCYERQTSTLMHNKEISADTEIKLFEQFYGLNNRLRYCNGSFYKWADKEFEKKYNSWLESDDYKAKSFNLYYGNGVVD